MPASTPIASMTLEELKRSALMQSVDLRHLVNRLESLDLATIPQTGIGSVDALYRELDVLTGNLDATIERIRTWPIPPELDG